MLDVVKLCRQSYNAVKDLTSPEEQIEMKYVYKILQGAVPRIPFF
jgi:hypothetical protein